MKLSLLHEDPSPNCPACGNPTSIAELNSYNGSCEDCWTSGIKTKTNSRSVQVIRTPAGSKEYGSASDDKGRDVSDNRKIFKSSENKGHIYNLLWEPKNKLARLRQDLLIVKLDLEFELSDKQLALREIKKIQAEINTVNREIAQIKAETPTNPGVVGGI